MMYVARCNCMVKRIHAAVDNDLHEELTRLKEAKDLSWEGLMRWIVDEHGDEIFSEEGSIEARIITKLGGSEGMKSGELADAIGYNAPYTRKTLAHMHADGAVERYKDGRAFRYVLPGELPDGADDEERDAATDGGTAGFVFADGHAIPDVSLSNPFNREAHLRGSDNP